MPRCSIRTHFVPAAHLRQVLARAAVILIAIGISACRSTPEKGIPKVPKSEALQSFTKGKRLYYSDRFADATEQLNAFLDAFPQSPLVRPALYYLGLSYKGAKDMTNANPIFERLASDDGASIWAEYVARQLRRQAGN